MLKTIKTLALGASTRVGLSRLLLDSPWRRRRLLILCYHGVSMVDEHQWDPALFIPPERLRSRFAYLRRAGCNLLQYSEAVRRLREGTLPPRAVTVTFDDGTYDFLVQAMPLVREFGVPTTLFFATYYSFFNRPIYDLAVDYVLWKAGAGRLELKEVFAEPFMLDGQQARATATAILRHHAHANDLTPEEKDELLERLAAACKVDLASIRRRRILHVMTPAEAASVAKEGVDIQLHTHRHRVYDDRPRFDVGIDDNRRSLAEIRPGATDHFCYPGGMYLDAFPQWLEQKQIRSAVTCDTGLAARTTSPWLLPRLCDTTAVSSIEFSAWVSGLAHFLPKRARMAPEWMLVRSEPQPRAAMRSS